jgi:tetratricopeptide (TPR) repeat protein
MSARWPLAAVVFIGLVRSALADPFVSTPQAQPPSDMAVCARETSIPASYEDSLAACTRVINTGGGTSRASAFHNRCALFIIFGEAARAIPDCDQALRLNPGYVSAYNNRGAAQVILGANAQALQAYDRALQIEPNNPIALNGRCYSLAVVGRAAEALVNCDRALQLQSNDVNALDSRGYAYLRLGRWAEARRDYDAAIAGNADNAISWFARAIVRAQQGDQAGAQADLATARRLRASIDTDAARVSLTAPALGAPSQH